MTGKLLLVEQHELALHHGRDRLVARSLRHLHEIRQEDRHADRRNQRRQAERAAQRPVGDALDRPVDQRGEQHRHDQHDEQRQRDRADAEPGGQDQERDQRDEGRHHEHVAMGEVHHADDAEHHRVADGDQAVDRTERDAVDELLDEIVHASKPFPNPVKPLNRGSAGAATRRACAMSAGAMAAAVPASMRNVQ